MVALSNNQTKENMGLPNEISNDLYIDDDDRRMTIINELKDNIQGWFNYNIIYTT